jgi:hypothetical protein
VSGFGFGCKELKFLYEIDLLASGLLKFENEF